MSYARDLGRDTNLPFCPAYPNSQPGIIYGQLYTERGTTPVARPIFAEESRPDTIVVAAVASNLVNISHGIDIPVASVTLHSRPKSYMGRFQGYYFLLFSPLGARIYSTNSNSLAENRTTSRVAREAKPSFARICMLAICLFCILIPVVTVAAMYSQGLHVRKSPKSRSACFSLAPVNYAPNVYMNSLPGNTQTAIRSLQMDGSFATDVAIQYDWYHSPCANCFLFIGIPSSPTLACYPTKQSSTSSAVLYTLQFRVLLSRTGCYQILSSEARGRVGDTCQSRLSASSGSVIATIWVTDSP